MTEQGDLFNRAESRSLRDAGMESVREHSSIEWRRAYGVYAGRWLSSLTPGTTFTGEDLRLAVQPVIGQPHHHNAWGGLGGALIRQLLKEGVIVTAGWREAGSPQAHARRYPLYRKVLHGPC